jgi:hypothetical protein
VADGAPDCVEHGLAARGREGLWPARRRREESHEVREGDHVGAVRIVQVGSRIELRHHAAIALRTVLVREERARDPHFVQIGIR